MLTQDIVKEIQQGLRREEMVIYLQSKYEILTGKLIGAEVLARWEHPKRGVLTPEAFVGQLETCELIHELDFYMFRKTCELLRDWREKGLSILPLSINLSAFSLSQTECIDKGIKWMKYYQIPIEWIEIELTESALARENQWMIEQVNRLKQIGFKILMDDFGTGYSSLNRLREFEVDVIKLDKVFLKNIMQCEKSKHIVTSMVELGKKLGLAIVAEGIEESEQLEFLKQIKCDEGQGFLLSVPMPVAQFEKERMT